MPSEYEMARERLAAYDSSREYYASQGFSIEADLRLLLVHDAEAVRRGDTLAGHISNYMTNRCIDAHDANCDLSCVDVEAAVNDWRAFLRGEQAT